MSQVYNDSNITCKRQSNELWVVSRRTNSLSQSSCKAKPKQNDRTHIKILLRFSSSDLHGNMIASRIVAIAVSRALTCMEPPAPREQTLDVCENLRIFTLTLRTPALNDIPSRYCLTYIDLLHNATCARLRSRRRPSYTSSKCFCKMQMDNLFCTGEKNKIFHEYAQTTRAARQARAWHLSFPVQYHSNIIPMEKTQALCTNYPCYICAHKWSTPTSDRPHGALLSASDDSRSNLTAMEMYEDFHWRICSAFTHRHVIRR